MDFKPGDTIYEYFPTSSFSGGLTNADATPTGTLYRNGTADGAVTVTITNVSTGWYKAAATIPATYIPTDIVNLGVFAAVGSINGAAQLCSIKVGDGFVSAGTATAGGATSITLQTALGADSLGVGALIEIVAGVGAGQSRIITAYVNSTQVATVNRAWVTNPTSASVYAIRFIQLPTTDASLRVDVGAINGSTNAAANLALICTSGGTLNLASFVATNTNFGALAMTSFSNSGTSNTAGLTTLAGFSTGAMTVTNLVTSGGTVSLASLAATNTNLGTLLVGGGTMTLNVATIAALGVTGLVVAGGTVTLGTLGLTAFNPTAMNVGTIVVSGGTVSLATFAMTAFNVNGSAFASMFTGAGTSSQFTTTALANAPTGGGGTTNNLEVSVNDVRVE